MAADLTRKRNRHRLIELACICFAVALLGWFVFPRVDPLARAELNVSDHLVEGFGKRPIGDDFVFVAIDDPSMQLDQLWPEDIETSPELTAMSAGWPWPRNVYAGAIRKILGAGAKFVLVDLILDAPRPGDEALRAVLDEYPDRIVIGANFAQEAFAPDHPDILVPSFRFPADTLIDDPAEDPRVGLVNFWTDPLDQAARTAIYRMDGQHGNYSWLAGRALHLLGMDDKIPKPNAFRWFRFADTSAVPTIPFYTLFLNADWERTLKDGAVFKDKIVMIGPSAAILHDIQLIPGGLSIPGPLLHLNALAAAMDGAFYDKAGPWVSFTAILLASLLALVTSFAFRKNPLAAFFALVGACALSLLFVFVVATYANHVLPIVQPGSVFLIAGVMSIAWNFAQERRESGRMRSTLERYVSRNVVREILDRREDFLSALGGTRKPMTVFFSDVRGFTSFSEQEDASAVVVQLNEYLGEMVAIIFQHNGTVDKFMGDGIMAVWGNVVSDGAANDTKNAIRAALEMQDHISALNKRWEPRGLKPFTVGMGLHHGDAVFGNIGSNEKMEPTVIGDTVNVASRVEGLTKKYGVPICITQPVAELVSDDFRLRSVDLVQVVGKTRPVEIFTVLGPRSTEPPDWIQRYEGAIADFRARRFAEAAAELHRCIEEAPADKLCRIYLERAERFIIDPPPEEWTGTEVATSK